MCYDLLYLAIFAIHMRAVDFLRDDKEKPQIFFLIIIDILHNYIQGTIVETE